MPPHISKVCSTRAPTSDGMVAARDMIPGIMDAAMEAFSGVSVTSGTMLIRTTQT